VPQPIALSSAGGGALVQPGEAAGGGSGLTGRPKMQKAALMLYDAAPAGGGGAPGGSRGSIDFQFNPKEVTIAKTAKWERKTAKGASKAGPPEFNGSEPCKLTVEMFFDAGGAQDGSVVAAVEKLFTCCVPTPESLSSKKPSPPLVVLHWGSVSSFPAFVTSVSAKYTLFSSDGTPIRATCAVAMEEMPADPSRQNPTSGSQDVRRVHRTVAGDTLASVAYAEYGDPAQWRALAAYNGIDDPLRVRLGRTLLLPTPEELAGAGSMRAGR
jgi:nucleoid-associated protein YgaU